MFVDLTRPPDVCPGARATPLLSAQAALNVENCRTSELTDVLRRVGRVKRERRLIRQLRKTRYPPLADILAEHPYVARKLKHIRRPERYLRCALTVKSNPPHEPGYFVFGIYVVNIAELAKQMRRESHDAVKVQDFLVIPRDNARHVELYSGGSGRSRDMDAFCRKFRGPTDDGYGCHFDGAQWQSRDHHPTVLPREGKFRAAMNETLKEARRRARAGDFS